MWVYEAMLGVETIERMSSTAEVTGVQYDSRQVQAGDLFVAMQGGTTDGNQYIGGAIDRGAKVIVTDSPTVWGQRSRYKGVAIYLVASGRRALAGIAANLLGHPERALKVSAVTGTNGKTTTAYLLEQLLKSADRTCVLVGTIETHIGDEVRPSEHTTPEAADLLGIFADGVKRGATEAVMEMSSHALDQERVWGIYVDVAIFSNLTQDHLDYHGTMDAYAKAKARLFDGVGSAPPRIAVVNADDSIGAGLGLRSRRMTYGIDAGDYRATSISLKAGMTTYTWTTPEGDIQITSPLTGRVNVYNLLAASCAALARGLTPGQVASAVSSLRQVPGRFQVVPGSAEAGFTVVVDYAHTEDALANLIALGRELVMPAKGRVITLFGCGGDRDRTKRPKMGRVAGEGSDLVVLTSDNPRSEDPQAILDETFAGIQGSLAECIVEIDRAAAIALAIGAAKCGDMVLLAGKGHEKVQILAAGTHPFDDVAIAAEVLSHATGTSNLEPTEKQ